MPLGVCCSNGTYIFCQQRKKKPDWGIENSAAAGEKLKIPRKKEKVFRSYTVIIDEIFLLQILMYSYFYQQQVAFII